MTPTKVYPTRVRFYLCEDVRREADNKVSLMGLFAGDEVLIVDDELRSDTSLESLCVYAVFEGGSGTFHNVLKLISPAGGVQEMDGGEVSFDAEVKHAITIKFKPFPVSALGTYRANVVLDGRDYVFEFFVRLDTKVPT